MCLSDLAGISLFVIRPHCSSSVSVKWCILCLCARVSFENIFLLFFRFLFDCALCHFAGKLCGDNMNRNLFPFFFFWIRVLCQQLRTSCTHRAITIVLRAFVHPIALQALVANALFQSITFALYRVTHPRSQTTLNQNIHFNITESTNKRIGTIEMSNSATTEWMLSPSYRIYSLSFLFVHRYRMRRAPLSAFRSMSVGSFFLHLLSLSPDLHP